MFMGMEKIYIIMPFQDKCLQVRDMSSLEWINVDLGTVKEQKVELKVFRESNQISHNLQMIISSNMIQIENYLSF